MCTIPNCKEHHRERGGGNIKTGPGPFKIWRYSYSPPNGCDNRDVWGFGCVHSNSVVLSCVELHKCGPERLLWYSVEWGTSRGTWQKFSLEIHEMEIKIFSISPPKN